jgi:hypothetical protein
VLFCTLWGLFKTPQSTKKAEMASPNCNGQRGEHFLYWALPLAELVEARQGTVQKMGYPKKAFKIEHKALYLLF